MRDSEALLLTADRISSTSVRVASRREADCAQRTMKVSFPIP